ncbi:MAG: hypothetical protein ACI4U0_01150 [Candidatus Aphodocola sp.]
MGIIFDLLRAKETKERMKDIDKIHNKQINDDFYGSSNYKIVFRDSEVNKGGKKHGK